MEKCLVLSDGCAINPPAKWRASSKALLTNDGEEGAEDGCGVVVSGGAMFSKVVRVEEEVGTLFNCEEEAARGKGMRDEADVS
jgi:hypothetical protein